MIFAWLKRRRRRKLLARPFPETWGPWLEQLPFYAGLDEAERARLHDILRVIHAEKRWEGCGGLDLTEEMKVVIAVQAALLVLEIEHDHYRRVKTILVYPSAYQTPRNQQSGAILGEAWYRGPVVLSWDSALHGAIDPKDGRNLVWHEFAHKLDMLDGLVDGTPPLHDHADYAQWRRIMSEEFAILRGEGPRGRRSMLDRYGATNEAEFFAVATETFFEKPLKMERKQPDLYGILRNYFRQDPAARLRRAAGVGEAD